MCVCVCTCVHMCALYTLWLPLKGHIALWAVWNCCNVYTTIGSYMHICNWYMYMQMYTQVHHISTRAIYLYAIEVKKYTYIHMYHIYTTYTYICLYISILCEIKIIRDRYIRARTSIHESKRIRFLSDLAIFCQK